MIFYEYAHGGDIYDENGHADKNTIDFSANINPLGMPEGALAAAKNSIARANIYPDSDCRLLCAKLSAFENVDKSNIFCSNGASDILFRLVFAVKPKKILVTAPSFADYERAGRAAGAEVIYYTQKKENDFGLEGDIVDLIRETSPDIVFVCNPNNPTGNLTDLALLQEMAEVCKLLLVDECFLDFVSHPRGHSAKSLVGKYKNTVVLKAFTKIFAMPGLRLGYAICSSRDLIDRMKFCGPDWAVSNTAQEAGIAALENGHGYIADSREYVKKQREYIVDELKRMGFTVYPAHANFVFFHSPKAVLRDLKGIKIRDCSNFKGLEPGYYRTAVLTKEKNKLLIEAIEAIEALCK